MTRPVALATLLLAAVALPAGADPGWPASVTGTAEVVLASDGERVSTRLVFAAGVAPSGLRVELVRAGTLTAVLWLDEKEVRVLVPAEPPLLHVGAPTRTTLEASLGLPFCPSELLFALRAGLAPVPSCGEGPGHVVRREGRVVGLRRSGADPGDPLALEFLRFERQGSRTWPRRALLRAEEGVATVDVLSIQERPVAPSPPVGAAWDRAVRVEPAEIARALGVDGERR